MDALLAAIGKLLEIIAAAIKGKPVPEPSAPPPPKWGEIDKREDEEAAKRRAKEPT